MNGGDGVNAKVLKAMYEVEDEVWKGILEYFAERQKDSTETTVNRLMKVLEERGLRVGKPRIVDFFQRLSKAGCGRFVPGRKSYESRFAWGNVKMSEVGRIACGKLDRTESDENRTVMDMKEDLQESVPADAALGDDESCRVPNCGKLAKTRGLCLSHYQTAAKHIKEGKTTWEKLEKAGKVLPPKRINRSDWFLLDEGN